MTARPTLPLDGTVDLYDHQPREEVIERVMRHQLYRGSDGVAQPTRRSTRARRFRAQYRWMFWGIAALVAAVILMGAAIVRMDFVARERWAAEVEKRLIAERKVELLGIPKGAKCEKVRNGFIVCAPTSTRM